MNRWLMDRTRFTSNDVLMAEMRDTVEIEMLSSDFRIRITYDRKAQTILILISIKINMKKSGKSLSWKTIDLYNLSSKKLLKFTNFSL